MLHELVTIAIAELSLYIVKMNVLSQRKIELYGVNDKEAQNHNFLIYYLILK